MLSIRSPQRISRLLGVLAARNRISTQAFRRKTFAKSASMSWSKGNKYGHNNIMPLMNLPFPSLPELMMQQPPPPPPTIVNCGELRAGHQGQYVEMSGRFGKKRISRFAEIRDRNGITQLLINEEMYPRLARRFSSLPENSVISIIGRVILRPPSYRNESIKTGDIEVEVEDIKDVLISMGNRGQMNQKRSYSTMADTSSYKGITSTEYKRATGDNLIKYFENREHTCNELRLSDVGKTVQLVGWIQALTNSKFQQLRDGYGQTQIIYENLPSLEDLDDKTLLLVKGHVVARPKSNRNNVVDTGEIEVIVEELKVLDPSEPYNGPIKEKVSSEPQKQLEDANDDLRTPVTVPAVVEINKFTFRTHNCGELTIDNVNQAVVLCGWLEFHRMNKFIVLRDGYGHTQVILSPELSELKLDEIPFESILKIEGTVIPRPTHMRNPAMKTGDIEVTAKKIEILNESMRNLPIEVREHNRSKEVLRMEHRYIDLRFADMQKNLRTRSAAIMKMREYLINHVGFVEVETPTLFRRTPGGAQEFIVPTRNPGHFYSLVQSPQQFKQMLMAGAIDRYFQIARCYRDEATRPDRQPEFTQLDVELSFADRNGIMQLIEELLVYCLPKEIGNVTVPFPRITYDEAMEKYGTDKPDTRFDMTFKNITDLLVTNESLIENCEDFAAFVLVVKKQNAYLSVALKKHFENIGKELNCKFIINKMNKDSVEAWANTGALGKLVGSDVLRSLGASLEMEKGDLLFLAYGLRHIAQTLLGRIRLAFVEDLEARDIIPRRKNDQFNFLWVVDFPLFTKSETDSNAYESTHHPFTAPLDEDRPLLEKRENLDKIRSQAYDLVLNGQEVGGGSIRIHNHDEQLMVLEEVLKIPHEHLNHLLLALKSGCPPHGGIALGIDRLMSIICNTKSIRDVIAFPKGSDGKDHLSKAPVEISDEEKRLYGLLPFEVKSERMETDTVKGSTETK